MLRPLILLTRMMCEKCERHFFPFQAYQRVNEGNTQRHNKKKCRDPRKNLAVLLLSGTMTTPTLSAATE